MLLVAAKAHREPGAILMTFEGTLNLADGHSTLSVFWWTLTTNLEMQPEKSRLGRHPINLNAARIFSPSHGHWPQTGDCVRSHFGGTWRHIKFSWRIIVSAFWWTLTTHLEMQPGEIELDRLEFILNGVWICSASHVYWLYCSLSWWKAFFNY